ncbi:Gp49 family protein [Asticcacaulis taihuensis]|uniref:Gp49 family protein n=1 Tax=Asticcacaulis taihuensis TaxID=260084 RepID=UPI0026F0CC6D|nr:Gp49 family protein [Asticcacaulis taihuensis]
MKSEALAATEALSARGATAPRVSLASMEGKIAAKYTFTADKALEGVPVPSHARLDQLTICLVVMDNGFVIIGKSAPASPENFDADKGATFAYEDAIKQLWPLEGYALRDRLSAKA